MSNDKYVLVYCSTSLLCMLKSEIYRQILLLQFSGHGDITFSAGGDGAGAPHPTLLSLLTSSWEL